jgi:prepilin peptidase CpaA
VFASYVIIVATAALLFYAALTDLKQYTIPNGLIIALALLFILHVLILNRWSELPWNIAFVLLIFLILIFFYSLGWIGGGDVKLLTVALLWTGIHCALVFAIILLICVTVHTVVVKLKRVKHRNDSNPVRIAFAPSIAAAFVGVLMLGCTQ